MKRTLTLFAAVAIGIYALGSCIQFALASTTAILLPQWDGSYKQLTPKSGSSHFAMVKETLCNGTTDYNSTGTITVSARDSYGTSVTSIGMGDGAIISQIDLISCASLNSGTGWATASMFYRWNGVDSSNVGTHSVSGTTPVSLTPTTTISGLSLFKTSTSILEIGGIVTTTGTKGYRLSRIATRLTYTLTIPTAPSSLAATDTSSSQITLAWNDNSNNELGFKIYRKLNNGSFAQTATTASWNATSYSDTGLTADQTYSYEVIAYNSAGTSTSNTSTAITYNTTPSAPTGLSAAVSGSDIVLSWTDNSTNEDGFKVERSTDNVNFFQIATMTINFASTTSYKDIGAAGTTYYWRVRAYNPLGNSAYTGTATDLDTITVSGDITSASTWGPTHIYVINSGLTPLARSWGRPAHHPDPASQRLIRDFRFFLAVAGFSKVKR